jgi:hypothetical protein
MKRALDQFRYMVFHDPKWDWRTFDVDRDVAKADHVLHGLLTAIDPKSMSLFFKRGPAWGTVAAARARTPLT